VKFALSIFLHAFILGCGSKPVTEEPDAAELVGVWECSEFPSGFLARAGVSEPYPVSRIVIRADGSCHVVNLPQRSPDRFDDLPASSWALVAPSMTPSGAWSVEIAGHFLQCLRDGDELVLRCVISGMDGYAIIYRRQ
jgi:hypothetical protein